MATLSLRNLGAFALATTFAVTCGRWGSNWIALNDKRSVPVELGAIQSALWIEMGAPEYGFGQGWLVMSDEDIDCEDLETEYGYYFYGLIYSEEDNFLGQGSGMLALYAWWQDDDSDAGYEGIYSAGGYSTSEEGELERRMLPVLYGDGVLWLDYYGAAGHSEILEHSDDQVVGTINSDLLDARFTAENCGSFESDYYDDDDDWYYETGR